MLSKFGLPPPLPDLLMLQAAIRLLLLIEHLLYQPTTVNPPLFFIKSTHYYITVNMRINALASWSMYNLHDPGISVFKDSLLSFNEEYSSIWNLPYCAVCTLIECCRTKLVLLVDIPQQPQPLVFSQYFTLCLSHTFKIHDVLIRAEKLTVNWVAFCTKPKEVFASISLFFGNVGIETGFS